MLAEIVRDSLVALGVEAEVLACDPELADTAVFCAAYGIDPADSANTILMASKRPQGIMAACVVLATHRLDVNHAVRDAMSVKKVSFASGELTMLLTAMEIGGVTPFGLPSTMPILVDADVLQRESIVLGGGNRSSKLRVEPGALRMLSAVEIVEGLAHPV